MISTHHNHKNNIGILISSGFAERDVVTCLAKLRSAGLPTSLIGRSNKLTHSQHGLVVRPDLSLNQISDDTAFHLLIIPGYYECVVNLMASPDFHVQIKANISNNNYIAVLNDAKTALEQANLLNTPCEHILHQDKQSLNSFCEQLIQLAITKN